MGSCSVKELSVCTKGKSCARQSSDHILKALKKTIAKCDLEDFYKVKKAKCFGLCKYGPIIMVEPEGVGYGGVEPAHLRKIVSRHAKRKKPLKGLVINFKKK